MREIWIPLFLITLFLFLHITRPFIKILRAIGGLAWLPLVAFLFTLVLFPAYGFRPEVVPLLIYAAILTVTGILKQAKDNAIFKTNRRVRTILLFPPLILLAVTAGAAFFFTPQKDTALITRGVHALKASSGENEYYIRVYTNENENRQRPLLILLPPALGSTQAIDQVSGELRDRGFTVLNYSRRGLDAPALHNSGEGKPLRYRINPVKWFRHIHALTSGTVSAAANSAGRELEEARRDDLLFLLTWIRQNPLLEGETPLFNTASRDTVFLAGYDAGGSALLLSDPGMGIRGIIAIESSLWSLYSEEILDLPALPPDADWLASVLHGLEGWYLKIKPKKLTGPGEPPGLSVPLLFLASDRVHYPGSRYRAMLKSYDAARGPAILVSADGAGLLDYSDFPDKYPLVTALVRGRGKSKWNNTNAPFKTSEIITGFAASVLGPAGEARSCLDNVILPAEIMITPNEAWPP